MKKIRFLALPIIASIMLSGCIGDDGGGVQTKKNNDVHASTVYDLKKKYGKENEKAIMPMYNVEKNQEFIFDFKSDLNDLSMSEVISVHTDIKALPESEILSLKSLKDPMADNTIISIKPSSGVLNSSQTLGGLETSWGNAPIYYIRINYDLDATTPTKLDQPMIIPFTVKSDVQVPTASYEISQDGRLKLVWNEVEGADEYRIYQASNISLLETQNTATNGAEKGYIGVFPRLVGTVKGTEFNDFLKTGNGALLETGEEIISGQNIGVNGEYYITAVKDGKESNFSPAVSTVDLSKRLPMEFETNIAFNTYATAKELPQTAKIKFIDGSVADKEVVYDTSSGADSTKINFTIKGTALKGYVNVEGITEKELESIGDSNDSAETVAGLIETDNTTEYVPNPELPTIIPTEEDDKKVQKEKTEKEQSKEVVKEQKEVSEKQVEEGNKEAIPSPKVVEDLPIHADSALEEYLALNMIDGKTEISLKAFPEAQNFETIEDVMLKVMYQNPLILGANRYGYDYDSLTLSIEYDDSTKELKAKQEKIIKAADKIVKDIIKKDMSDEEKRKAIYDYLNENTKYDTAALENGAKNNYQTVDPEFNDSFTTYGIMVEGIGVCASYASTFKMLSDLAGLESIVVTGTMDNVGHAWNKVKIGDEWLNVDSTNNGTNSGVPYMIYNTNDETIGENGFVLTDEYWIDSEIAQFGGKDNSHDYYVKNKLEIKSISDYEKLVEDQMKSGKESFAIRMDTPLNMDDIYTETGEALQEHAPDKLETASMESLGMYIIIKK